MDLRLSSALRPISVLQIVEVELWPVETTDGWSLELRRYRVPEALNPRLRPLLFIPGYCMNTFILAFHPRGTSIVEYLARAGFEVWTANLRAQGDSQFRGARRRVGLSELARIDMPAVVERVLSLSTTEVQRLDIIGCSLGGAIVYAYLAHTTDAPVGALVGIGAPLTWVRVHPAIRLMFGSRRVASRLAVSGTRRLARTALPLARRVPSVLSIYMNAKNIDLSDAQTLTQTVDDPEPNLNWEIAGWMKSRALVVDGVDVARALGRVDLPILVLLANRDGIVPRASARSVLSSIGSQDTEILEVGDPEEWFAHADLFIGDHAEARVFEPLVRWLAERNDA